MSATTNQTSHGSKILSLWPLGAVILVLGFALLGDRGVIHLHKLTLLKKSLMTDLEEIQAQNDALRQEIVALRGDRKYIEQLARTELGMVRDDELVFQFANRSLPGGSQ